MWKTEAIHVPCGVAGNAGNAAKSPYTASSRTAQSRQPTPALCDWHAPARDALRGSRRYGGQLVNVEVVPIRRCENATPTVAHALPQLS